jgi:type VI secretion system secreted protein Hcp
MPFDSYLKLGDIAGESTSRDHAGEIEVSTWSWGSDADGDQVIPSGLCIAKTVDGASPMILALHVNGQSTDAVLTVERAGQDRCFAVRLTLGDVRVNSVQVSASGADSPMETIVLSYRRLKMECQPQGPDGRPLDIVEFGYDVGGPDAHR